MFVRKNILKQSIWSLVASVLLCVPYSQAQQDEKTTSFLDSNETDETSDSTGDRHIERLGEVSTDDWQMELALPEAAASSTGGGMALLEDTQRKHLQTLLSRLADQPGNTTVLAQLDTLLSDVLRQANDLINNGSIEQAEQLLSLIQSIDPGIDGFSSARTRLQDYEETNKLVKAGDAALETSQILQPPNSSALHYYQLALGRDNRNQGAQQGLERVQKALVERALESASELDFETAEQWLSEASMVREDQETVEEVRLEVAEFKKGRAVELEERVLKSIQDGNFNMADFSIIDLIALGGNEAVVSSLMTKLEEARHYGGYEPGQIISDELLKAGGAAPEIVVIAAGSFLMGSPQRADEAKDNEKPQHRVTIARGFGIGVREVTVAEFRLFIEQSGYRTAAERTGNSRIYDEAAGRLSPRDGVDWEYDYRGKKASPDLPVLHVDADDAQAYVNWLSDETGKSYRLPSEAEYEYVAKAGGNSMYWWGEGSPSEIVENLTGDRDASPSKRQWTTFFKKYGDGHWGPAPAGSFDNDKLVHPMGVYDIAGNVSEWMEDCWHQNYVKAPANGSAWVNPGCSRRVARGGYWASAPEQARASYRFATNADHFGPVIGIRIARDL